MEKRMSTQILHQEFHYEDPTNRIIVRTACDKKCVTMDMLIGEARQARLAAGTIIKVQTMTKDLETRLWEADFEIYHAKEISRRIIDERGERMGMVREYKCFQRTIWTASPAVDEEVAEPEKDAPRVPEKYVQGEGSADWNVGKGMYAINVDGQRLAWVRDKEEALSIAAGSRPLPIAA